VCGRNLLHTIVEVVEDEADENKMQFSATSRKRHEEEYILDLFVRDMMETFRDDLYPTEIDR
jgi:hypothetical protein